MSAGTYSFKGTADMSQHNQQIEKAKQEISKYKNEVTKAQRETNKLANPNFSKAYSSQRQLQNTVKQTTNVLNGLSGNMMGAIAKFGPYAAAAVAAFKVVEAAIKKAMAVNDTFNDRIDKLTGQIKGAFDELANRISRMDFSNLLSGLATAAKYAGQIREDLDRAGTFQTISNPAISEAQNEITRLRIQIQELQVRQKELKKQGKDYSDIEAQVAAINKLIDIQLGKLMDIYNQQRKNAYSTAIDVASYMGVNNQEVSRLYGVRGVDARNMRALLDIMSNNDWAANSRAGVTGVGGLDAGEIVNFIANEVGSPLLSETQKFFKQALEAWGEGDTKGFNTYMSRATGANADWASNLGDSMKAIYKWYESVKSRMTEGNNGNLTAYANALNEANAAYAAYLSAKQSHIGDESARVRVQWTPSGGSGGGKSTPDWVAGSIAEIDDQIKKLKDRLANEKFDIGVQTDINKQIEDLQNQKAMMEVQVAINGNTDLKNAFGDLLNGMLDASDVETFSKELLTLLDNYLASAPELQLPPFILPSAEMQASAKEAMAELEKIIDEEYTKMCKEIQARNQEMADSFSGLGSIFSSFGEMIGTETTNWATALGDMLSIIGETISKLVALASANGVASAMELPFPANLGAVATVLAGIASAVSTIRSYSNEKYAGGGIFEGSGSRIGDMHLARVNPGEMILNNRQQANLFRMLNNSAISGGVKGSVTFHISGTDLVGVLDNQNRKTKRVR